MIELILEDLAPHKPHEPHDIFGKVYFKDGDFTFPSAGWTDFAYPIIFWWCQHYNEMITSGLDRCEFLFMDGNYSVEVRNHHATVDLLFLKNDAVIHEMNAISKSVMKNLLKNAFIKIDAMKAL